MTILQNICFVLLFSTLSNAYAGSCFEEPYDVADCRVKADQGDAKAQSNLGMMYALGQGVIQSKVMAHMYWNIAAVSGDEDAIKYRGIVEKEMTATQLAEAQKLAREWMRKHQ